MILAKLKYYDMPDNCEECDPDLAQAIHCNHWIEGQTYFQERPPACPLIEVRDGDLMNMLDALKRIRQRQTVTIKREAIE